MKTYTVFLFEKGSIDEGRLSAGARLFVRDIDIPDNVAIPGGVSVGFAGEATRDLKARSAASFGDFAERYPPKPSDTALKGSYPAGSLSSSDFAASIEKARADMERAAAKFEEERLLAAAKFEAVQLEEDQRPGGRRTNHSDGEKIVADPDQWFTDLVAEMEAFGGYRSRLRKFFGPDVSLPKHWQENVEDKFGVCPHARLAELVEQAEDLVALYEAGLIDPAEPRIYAHIEKLAAELLEAREAVESLDPIVLSFDIENSECTCTLSSWDLNDASGVLITPPLSGCPLHSNELHEYVIQG
jgi:hypothetical protein